MDIGPIQRIVHVPLPADWTPCQCGYDEEDCCAPECEAHETETPKESA